MTPELRRLIELRTQFAQSAKCYAYVFQPDSPSVHDAVVRARVWDSACRCVDEVIVDLLRRQS